MNNTKDIISHVREPDLALQMNDEHQMGVATLSEKFATEFGMGQCGRVMGLLHDKGKEQQQWQAYIRRVTGLDRKYDHFKNRPHHAYVGACIAEKKYAPIAPLIGQPIAGHHRGLYDYCDYIKVAKEAIPTDVTIGEKITYQLPELKGLKKHDLHHLIRMMFSCLVDADSLDTEQFMSPDQAALRGNYSTIEELVNMLEAHLHNLKDHSPDTEVNRIRNYVQEQCLRESQGPAGFYSLTVPTGGGKTLSSLLWALRHGQKNHLHRIIIAIPYTSIIVQTAATLKSIFGEKNVLEHHSNINPDEIKDEKLRTRLQLAMENWDYPIIVTTNVQLLESLFSNRRSDCRKLHNIVNSVVILDEVQTLPMGFYKPIVDTLDTLQRLFGISLLFTTASQPVLTGRIVGTNPQTSFEALKSIHEIIPPEAKLHQRLRRVELDFLKHLAPTNK